MQERNDIDGYPLFTEVLDDGLRQQNRATTLANIMEDCLHPEGSITEQGRYICEMYWDYVKETKTTDLTPIYSLLEKEVAARGFV